MKNTFCHVVDCVGSRSPPLDGLRALLPSPISFPLWWPEVKKLKFLSAESSNVRAQQRYLEHASVITFTLFQYLPVKHLYLTFPLWKRPRFLAIHVFLSSMGPGGHTAYSNSKLNIVRIN